MGKSPLITLTEDNQTKTGHVKATAPLTKIITQHDWEELGFTIVKEDSKNADGFVDEKKDKMTPFFKNLYTQLDTNKDSKISREELKQTLTNTDLRDRWSKLIGYHPTEWQAESNSPKWSLLNTLLENNKELLRHEKERIDNLRFWDKVPEIAATPQVYHFHPVAFWEFIQPNLSKKVYPINPNYRSHFVIHSTDGNMSKTQIQAITARSKAHKYIMKDGEVIEIWPFTEKQVWATKIESLKGLKGRMFHVELNYASGDLPTEKQYHSLANLYIEAANVEGCWPIIVPHIEVDRGIKNGHADPTDFDYNKFYQILRNKNVPIDIIPHFSHDRYWSYSNSKVPWGTDTTSWPPVLEGNPHK